MLLFKDDSLKKIPIMARKKSHRTLQDYRESIDSLDRKLLDLLNERSRIVEKIGRLKEETNESIYVPLREKQLVENLMKKNKGPFPNHAVYNVFKEIVSASRAMQAPLYVSYLGPAATFTHMAAIKHFGRSAELRGAASIARVFEEVEHDRSEFGVVPIENSTEGVVNHTLDLFLSTSLNICAEVTLEIAHNLVSKAGSLSEIQRIYAHPQAVGQCREWLEKNVSGVSIIEVESSAEAAQRAILDSSGAAIASEYASQLYNLQIVKGHIEDYSNNMTRFLIIGKEKMKKTGKDKTSILFSVKDEVGILYKMLDPFYRQKINLTKIESRPLKKRAWEYVFFVDFEGHVAEQRVKKALNTLHSKCTFLKILGSYPRVRG